VVSKPPSQKVGLFANNPVKHFWTSFAFVVTVTFNDIEEGFCRNLQMYNRQKLFNYVP